MDELPSAPKEWVPDSRSKTAGSSLQAGQAPRAGIAAESDARSPPEANPQDTSMARDDAGSVSEEHRTDTPNPPGLPGPGRLLESVGRPQSVASWHSSERVPSYGRPPSAMAGPMDFAPISSQYDFADSYLNLPPLHSSRGGTPSSTANQRSASRALSDGRAGLPTRPPSARSTTSSAPRGGHGPPFTSFFVPKDRTAHPGAFTSSAAPSTSRSGSHAEPRVIDPRSLDHPAADPLTRDPRAPDPRAPDPRAPDPRAPRVPDPRVPDTHASDHGAPDPHAPDPHAPDPRAPEIHATHDERALDPRTFTDRWKAAQTRFSELMSVMDEPTLRLGFMALKVMAEPSTPHSFVVAESEVWSYIKSLEVQVSRRTMDELQLQVEQQMMQRHAQQFIPPHQQVFHPSQSAPSAAQTPYGQVSFQQPVQQFQQPPQFQSLDPADESIGYAMPPGFGEDRYINVKGPSGTSRKTAGANARGPRQQSRDSKNEDDAAKPARRTHGKKAHDGAYNVPLPAAVADVPTPASTRPIDIPDAPPPKPSKDVPKRRSVRVRGWTRQPHHLVTSARDIFREFCAKLAPIASAMEVTVPALLNNLQGSNANPAARWNLFQQFFRLEHDYTPRRQFDDLFADRPSTAAYDLLRGEVGDERFDDIMQEFAVTFPNGTDRASELDSQEIFDAVVCQIEDTAAVYSAFYKIEIFCLLAGADINLHGKDMAAAIMTERSSGFQRRSRLALDGLIGQYRAHLFHAVAEEQMAALFADTEAVVPKADLRVGGPVRLPDVRKLPANPSSANMRNMIYVTLKALFDAVHPSLFPFDESDHMPWKLLHCNLAKYGLVLEGWDWAIPVPNLLGTRLDRGIGGLNSNETNLLYQQVIKRPLPLSINWSEENDMETQQQYISPQGALAVAPVIISTEILLKDTRHAWHGRRIVLYSNGMTTQLPVRDLRSLTALAVDEAKVTTGRRKKEITFVDPDLPEPAGTLTGDQDDEPAESEPRRQSSEPGGGHERESANDASRSRKRKSREFIGDSDLDELPAAPVPDRDERLEADSGDDDDQGDVRSQRASPIRPPFSDSEDESDREQRSRASLTATPVPAVEPSPAQQPQRPVRAARASKPVPSAAEVAANAAAAAQREAALNVKTREQITFRLDQINEDIALKRGDRATYKHIVIGALKEEERQLKQRLKELPAENDSGVQDTQRKPKRRSKEVTPAAENASDDDADNDDDEPPPKKKPGKKPPAKRANAPRKGAQPPASRTTTRSATKRSTDDTAPAEPSSSKRAQNQPDDAPVRAPRSPTKSPAKARPAASVAEAATAPKSRKRARDDSGNTDELAQSQPSPKRPRSAPSPSKRVVEVVLDTPSRSKGKAVAARAPSPSADAAGLAPLPSPPYSRLEGLDAVLMVPPSDTGLGDDFALPAGVDMDRTVAVLTSMQDSMLLGDDLDDNDHAELLYLRSVWPKRTPLPKLLRGLMGRLSAA